MALPTDENTFLALEPINLMTPTTMTRMTANITAYSAMSCPRSSNKTTVPSVIISTLRSRLDYVFTVVTAQNNSEAIQDRSGKRSERADGRAITEKAKKCTANAASANKRHPGRPQDMEQ
jgi:hypothetical protein